MSKNLRVFFLSVLVFLLAVSSAMAASLEKIQVNAEGNDEYYGYDGSTLTIKKNATYTFASSDVKINTLDLSAITEVEINLPKPNPYAPGYGTTGEWKIKFPSKKAKVTINQADVHASVIADGINWKVPADVDFTLNAPIRVNNKDKGSITKITLKVTVDKKGKMTFGKQGRIYGNSSDERVATGFITDNTASYDVAGTMEIQNEYAIIGSGLTATVSETGELILNTGSSELNLKGIKDDKGARESSGAVINVDGGTISTPSDLKLFGEIHSSTGKVKKGGAGTLTLSQSSSWPKPALSHDVTDLQVLKGALVLNGQPSWNAAADGVKVTASNDATFTANAKSIYEEGESFAIVVNGTATATFTQHSIYKGNEIYPYGDFINNDNGLVINVEGVTASVAQNAKLVIDNGAFPVENITGKGTVQINNSDPTKDKAVLILTSPDLDTSKFTGKITGSANLGLYYADVDAINAGAAFTASSLFPKATVKFDNVLVYGPAVLEIEESADLKNVNTVWLRGNRPGAKNSDPKIAASKITVGGLKFANASADEIPYGDPNSDYDREIDLTELNIKIDGTSNAEGRATITLDPQVEAKIANITFYANRDIDFGGSYVEPAAGIYALTIDGSNQPSRLVIDGTTVTGDGLDADFANKEKVYQVNITDSSDVKFTGANGDDYYPLAKNNSLYVGKDAKLEIARGAIIGGHVTFGGSTGDIPVIYPKDAEAAEKAKYPNDSWFAPRKVKDEISKWNDSDLNNYSTFTTQVGKYNRVTNNYGEYAVKVTGDLTLSFDKDKADNDEAYPGKIVVRTKPDMDAFAGYLEDSKRFTTAGELFKVLGTDTGKYTKDFTTSYNKMFEFRIPSANADPQGVTVGVRKELAIVEFGKCSFVRGGEEFGQGAGHNFEIKAPVRIIIMGEEATISSETISGKTYYYLTNGTGKCYLKEKPQVFFRKYEDGLETAIDNVLDEDKWSSSTLVRDTITLQSTFELADSDGKPYVRLIGTSYSRDDPVNVSLALLSWDKASYPESTLTLGGVIPAYTTYTFVREGAPSPETGLQWSTAHTYAEELSKTDFTVGDEGTASFVVEGVRKATYNPNAAPVLVNGRYIWNVNADSGAYYMPDANGKDVRVTNLVVKRFDGNYLSKNIKSGDIEIDGATVTVTPSDNGVIVSVPAEKLGDNTSGKFVVEKGLSLFGQRVNDKGEVTGEIVTVPVAYMLHSKVDEDPITAYTLNNTVTIGGDSVSAYYDVDPNDLSGDLHFIGYGLPSWLGFSEHEGGFGYTTGDLTGVAPDTYTFYVLAYSGEGNNDSSNAHKRYTFTVTVEGTTGPAITANPVVVEKGKTATLTLTVSGGEEDTMRTFAITALGTAPTNIFEKATGINILGNGTATITVTAGQTEAVYSYYVSGGGLSTEFTVTVREPDPASVTIEEPVEENFTSAADGYTVRAIFTATANNFEGEVPEIEFEYVPANNLVSDLYTFESKDEEGNKLFIVEGIAKRNGDNEQSFKVNAKAGDVEAEEPRVVEFTVEEDPYAEDVTYPNTTGISFDGESTAVADGYAAKFPANVTADKDDVVLPSWLRPIPNDDDEVIGVSFVGYPLENLANGAKATVRIQATDNSENLADDDTGERYYGWDVVYNAKPDEPEGQDFMLQVDGSTTLSVALNATDTSITITPRNVQGTVTYESSASWVTVGTPDSEGKVTVTINPTDASLVGTQTVTIKATDAPHASGNDSETVELAITVTDGGNPPMPGQLSISAEPTSVTFDSPTASAKTVALGSNIPGTSFDATVSPSTGLTATVSGNTLTLTPSAVGSYTVTVTGTSGTQTARTTVSVTVEAEPITGQDLMLSTTGSTTLSVRLNTTDTSITLTPRNVQGTVSYTSSASWVTVNSSTGVVTINPTSSSLVGTQKVTITATDSPHSNGSGTANVTLNITVTSGGGKVGSSGGGCDAGFGAFALVLAAPLFLRRRRS